MSHSYQSVRSIRNDEDARIARRAAIIDTAWAMFSSRGYADTSMSAIALQVGGSKTTLWSLFRSKEVLFEAVVDSLVVRYGSRIEQVPLPNGSFEETLRTFGLAVMQTILIPDVLAFYRLVVAEASRFPEIGELFYQRGPGRAEHRLAEYIDGEMREGRLPDGDAELVARLFLQMCQANTFQKKLFNLQLAISPDDLAQDVEISISSILNICGK